MTATVPDARKPAAPASAAPPGADPAPSAAAAAPPPPPALWHPTPAAAPAPTAVRKGAVLAICCAALFLVGLDSTIVNVGLPAIGRALHTPLAGLQWTAAAYTITLASLLLLSGDLADRVGRRAVFQTGLAVFTLGCWLCSIAPGAGWLIAFRTLQGAGGSMLTPSALGIIANTFAGRDRARAIGIWDGVLGVSMALGPIAGGLLIAAAGWRGVFWAGIPVCLAAICLSSLLLPDSRAARPRRPDPVGQALVIALFAALGYAIIQGPACGWLSPEIFCCWMGAETALVALLAWESRRQEPLVELRLFRSAPFAGAVLAGLLSMVAMGGYFFLTTLYLQDVRGYSPLAAGVAVLPMPAALAILAPLAGRLVARRGPRIPLAIAGAALTAACAALAGLPAAPPTWYLAVSYALFGAGVGLASPAITNGVMAGVPAAQAGVASGMNSTSRQFGQALGVAVTGSLLASALRGGMRSGFAPAVGTAWYVLCGCAYLVLIIGLVSTTRWAAATAARAGQAGAAQKDGQPLPRPAGAPAPPARDPLPCQPAAASRPGPGPEPAPAAEPAPRPIRDPEGGPWAAGPLARRHPEEP